MAYICAICGKSYDKIADRAQCEINCAAAEEKRKKAEEEKRLKTEKVMLGKKIETKLNELEQLLGSYWERYNEMPSISYSLKNDTVTFTLDIDKKTTPNNSTSFMDRDEAFEKILRKFMY